MRSEAPSDAVEVVDANPVGFAFNNFRPVIYSGAFFTQSLF
jgi:hypothetical protein